MSRIASTMRAKSLSIYPILDDLLHSPSAGERLAAVSALEELPNPKYLVWLADRLGVEKPFIGYHATQALLAAARTLGQSRRQEVEDALTLAEQVLNGLNWKDPNQIHTLMGARMELDKQARAKD
jgi:hypothetical protein